MKSLFIFFCMLFFTILAFSKTQTWHKYWGNPGYNAASDVIINEGNYYIAGLNTTNEDSLEYSTNLVKIDFSGNTVFTKQLSDNKNLRGIVKFSKDNNNLIGVLNRYENSKWRSMILKTDFNGNLKYLKRVFPSDTINSNYLCGLMSITQISNGNFAIGGYYDDKTNDHSFWVAIVDSQGNRLKSKVFFGESPYRSDCYFVKSSISGGFYGTGIRGIDESENRKIIFKFDNDLNVVWADTSSVFLGKSKSQTIKSLIEFENGSIITTGQILDDNVTTNSQDIFILKYSEVGNKIWQKNISSSIIDGSDEATSIAKTSDGGFILAGTTERLFSSVTCKLWVGKFSIEGEMEWEHNYTHPSGGNYGKLEKIIATPDGGYLVVGKTGNWYNYNNVDMRSLIMKLDENGICDLSSIHSEDQMKKDFMLYQNYPNPFNPTTTIKFNLKKNNLVKLVISNTKGQYIKTLVNTNLLAGNHSFDFNATRLDSGIYYYTLQVGDEKITKKMLLVK